MSELKFYRRKLRPPKPSDLEENLEISSDLLLEEKRRRIGMMEREKIGSGLMRMNEMMDEYLLQRPLLDVSDVRFSITFERPDLQKMSVEQRMEKYQSGLGVKLGEGLGVKLGENEKKIIELMRGDSQITIDKLAEELKISTTAIENNIKKLRQKKVLKRIGYKGGRWEILE